jgi:hypothetical protein
MRKTKAVTIYLLILVAAPLFAAQNDEKALGQFQSILAAIDDRNFAPVRAAIDQADLTSRILNSRSVPPEARQALNDQFWQIIETSFLQNLPGAKSRYSWSTSLLRMVRVVRAFASTNQISSTRTRFSTCNTTAAHDSESSIGLIPVRGKCFRPKLARHCLS